MFGAGRIDRLICDDILRSLFICCTVNKKMLMNKLANSGYLLYSK